MMTNSDFIEISAKANPFLPDENLEKIISDDTKSQSQINGQRPQKTFHIRHSQDKS
jgi:hypothetical protein